MEADVGKKIAIIGGGVAGLSAGVYLQMNGYDTEIFEMHNLPGGVCTAWKRKGYTFDGCIHWLIGSGPSNPFHKIWTELHTTQNRRFFEYDEFMVYEDGDHTVRLYGDANKLEAELLRIAPEDEALIRDLCKSIRMMADFRIPVESDKMNFGAMLNFLFKEFPKFRYSMKWMKLSVPKFQSMIKSPVLRTLFENFYPKEIVKDFTMAGFVFMMSGYHAKSGGYPIGGSFEFAKAIENYYKELGGTVRYGERVSKILVSKGHATGIVSNGKEYPADVVISAADGYSTIYQMLDGKYVSKKYEMMYRERAVFPPLVQVSMGVAKDFRDQTHRINFAVDNPILLDLPGTKQERISLNIYNYDPTLAPAGKTSVVAMFSTPNYQYWFDLAAKDRARYDSEKSRIAKETIAAIDKRLPGFAAAVEVTDVATPYTTYRYTNNWKASYEGWLPDVKNMTTRLKKTLPGLKDFYMIGQWTTPGGGLPPAGKDGRDIAILLCKKDGKKFRVME